MRNLYVLAQTTFDVKILNVGMRFFECFYGLTRLHPRPKFGQIFSSKTDRSAQG